MNDLKNKSYWGKYTWYMFHTIAERLNDTFYENNYKDIYHFVLYTCDNLPCPYCREHAMKYLKQNIKVEYLTKKENFKRFLFNFHNTVNKRTNKSEIQYEELIIYKKINIDQLYDIYSDRFFNSYYGTKVFTDWYKNKYKEKLVVFWKNIRPYMK